MGQKQWGGLALLFLYVAIIVGSLYGYIHNIVMIVHSETTGAPVVLIVRVCGIFVVPLGIIMGYI